MSSRISLFLAMTLAVMLCVSVPNAIAKESSSPSDTQNVAMQAAKAKKAKKAKSKAISLSRAKVKLGVSTFAYNGKAKKPNVKVKLGKRTLKRGRDYKVAYKNNKRVGKGAVIIRGKGKYRGKTYAAFRIVDPKAVYRVASQAGKWSARAAQGKRAGAKNDSKELCAIKMKIASAPFTGSIKYRVHMRGGDWSAVKKDGKTAGSISQDSAIEALKAKLSGKMGQRYNVFYRVHTAAYGWSGWGRNGEAVGTLDLDCAIDGVQVKIKRKGLKVPASSVPKLKEPQLQRCLEILNDASGAHELTINEGEISDIHREWLDQYLEDDGHVVSLIAMNPTTGKCVAYNPDGSQFGASIIKAPMCAALCKYEAPDIDGDYVSGLMKEAMTHSNNSAYASLVSRYGNGYTYDFLDESDVSMSIPGGYGYCSARDICKIWANIYDYMENGTENVEFFKSLFPSDEDNVIAHGDGYYKAGWMGIEMWTGILFNQGGIYDGCVYGIMTTYSHGGEPEKMWDMIDICSKIVA